MSGAGDKPRPLADAAHRDRAMLDLDTSFAVEAAAGAGKTTVLVARLLRLVSEGRATLDQIVAITFTEKAAGELKVRLREELERALDGDLGDTTAARYRQALDDLGHAPIGTIHGFCASLLRERPVEAGVDPQFTVGDELASSLLRERVWETWLEGELAAGNPTLVRAVAHGIRLEDTPTSLYALANRMLGCRDLLDGCPPRPVGGADVAGLLAHARPQLAVLVDQLDTYCKPDKCAAYRDAAERARVSLVLAEGLGPAHAEATVLKLKLPGRFPGKTHWDRDASRDLAKGIHDGLRARLAALQEAIGQDLAAACAEAVRGYLGAYAAAKDAEGQLDFDDLLLVARNMLVRSREARDHFKARFRYLLVDEFQDTDPLQVEIVFFLAERPGQHAAAWDEAELEPGKLFIVGDPKQSIYRFRRADIEVYERAKQALARHGGTLILSQSFRPLRRLAEAINGIFEGLIRKPDDGAYQPAYVPLEPFRAEAPSRPEVVLLYPPPAVVDAVSYQDEFRRAEAQCVGAMVQRIVGEEWPVFDKRLRQTRPVRYGDIALLARTFTASDVYADVLAASDIPLRIIGGKHFYLATEVHSLISALKAIDNPHDGLSLVAALRGPFFGVSDDELLLGACAHGGLSYRNAGHDGPLGAAMGVLREFHERRNGEPIAVLLQRLLERTKVLELFALRPRGEQRVANVLKVVERARQLEAAEGVSFRGFVRWLSRLHETEADETESPLLEGEGDRVQFLSIHRSKGLEFPVVFVADMTSGGRRAASFIVLRDNSPADGQFAFHVGPKVQGCYTANWPGDAYDTVRAEAELVRLFYVATTRARDLLFLLPEWGKTEAGFTGFLPAETRGGRGGWGEQTKWGFIYPTYTLDLAEQPARPFRIPVPVEGAPPAAAARRAAARAQWIEALAARRASGEGVRWRTPSRLSEELLAEPEDAPRPGAGGEGLRIGSVVHRCLEQAPDLKAIAALVDAEATRLQLSDPARHAARSLVQAALDSPVMARARAAEACYHEVPFAVEVGGAVLSGAIDLLFTEPDGAVVVDFKTDAVRDDAELERLAAAYRPQVDAYALAAARTLCTPVKEVVLCFLSVGREWAVPVTESLLEDAAARIAAAE